MNDLSMFREDVVSLCQSLVNCGRDQYTTELKFCISNLSLGKERVFVQSHENPHQELPSEFGECLRYFEDGLSPCEAVPILLAL